MYKYYIPSLGRTAITMGLKLEEDSSSFQSLLALCRLDEPACRCSTIAGTCANSGCKI